MLILSRKEDEAIIIKLPNGDQIDVIVTQINGNHVRVGVDADDSVEIIREELVSMIRI